MRSSARSRARTYRDSRRQGLRAGRGGCAQRRGCLEGRTWWLVRESALRLGPNRSVLVCFSSRPLSGVPTCRRVSPLGAHTASGCGRHLSCSRRSVGRVGVHRTHRIGGDHPCRQTNHPACPASLISPRRVRKASFLPSSPTNLTTLSRGGVHSHPWGLVEKMGPTPEVGVWFTTRLPKACSCSCS